MDAGGAGEPAERLASLHKVLDNCTRWCDDGKEEKALSALREAKKQYKDDAEALLLLGKCYTDMEDDEEAISCINKSISLAPNKDWDKYVSLAQLQKGTEAIASFDRALQVLMKEHPEAVSTPAKTSDVDAYCSGENMTIGDLEDDKDKITQNDIRDIRLSMMDIYLTDEFWDQPDSKVKTKEITDYLLKLLPNDPETLQAVASYYLRIDDKEQAKKYLQQSLEQWEPKYSKLREQCKSGFADNANDALDFMDTAVSFEIIPTPDFRAATITLLGDVDETTKALEIGNNMLEAEKVREYKLYAAMAFLYEKVKNTEKQKEMLEEMFAIGVIEEDFDIEDNPGMNEEQKKERAEIIAKYVSTGGTEAQLKEKAEAKMEEADNMGSEDGAEDSDDDEDGDDDDDEDDDDDDDDMEE